MPSMKPMTEEEKKIAAEERAAKLAKLYDGYPMTIQLKVWTDYDPKTRKQRFEMRDFIIDNLQSVRAALNDIELLDMRYLKENPEDHPETYAIKTVGTTKVNASLPKLLFGFRAGTRKVKGASTRDLRREAYDHKEKK